MNTATYSLLTLFPDPERIDNLCVGLVMRDADGAWRVAVDGASKLAKLGSRKDADRVKAMGENLQRMLQSHTSLQSVRQMLKLMRSTFQLHEFEGEFAYSDLSDLHVKLERVIADTVTIKRKTRAAAVNRGPRLKSQLRKQFENMGILGKGPDDLAKHKIVPNFPVSEKFGLSVEFAIQADADVMHVTETVDFGVVEEAARGKVLEAQAKCLTLRSALDEFGANTRRYIVIKGGDAEYARPSVDLLSTEGSLFMHESSEDMNKYLQMIGRAAGNDSRFSLQLALQ